MILKPKHRMNKRSFVSQNVGIYIWVGYIGGIMGKEFHSIFCLLYFLLG